MREAEFAHMSREELISELTTLRSVVRHAGGRGSIPQALVSALADIAALKQQIAAMPLEPSEKDALIRQQARRIHGQRAALRVNWQIVEMRDLPHLRRLLVWGIQRNRDHAMLAAAGK